MPSKREHRDKLQAVDRSTRVSEAGYTLELGDALFHEQPIYDIKLLWTDPPYGTGKLRKDANGTYRDPSDTSYVIEAVVSWLPQMHEDGVVVVCCDYRLAPSITEAIVGGGWVYRGEIVWEFAHGRSRASWWPVRHNNLLTFTKTADSGSFDPTAVPRTIRLSPFEGDPEDKPTGSVWYFTMSTAHPDRVGYPTQKPLEIVEPFVLAHTLPGDLVVDIFCGSSTTGVAALRNNRWYHGIDANEQAIDISRERLSQYSHM